MKVLWFTGLSGSGKTTIANELCERLKTQGHSVRILDGDDIRNKRHQHLKFTPENIRENNRLIVELCLESKEDHDYVLVPVITPFRSSRKKTREKIGKDYIEIYVKASLQILIDRDVKGLYKKALNREIENFIGIAPKVPFEEPVNPDIIIDTVKYDLADSVNKIQTYIQKKV